MQSYADTGLNFNTNYYYQIRAIHPGGYSHLAEAVSATTQVEGAPYAEDKLSCKGGIVPPLYAEGEDIKWYDDEGLKNLVHSGHDFYTGKTEIGEYNYYVTQQYKGSRSLPNKVTLTISEVPVLSMQAHKQEIQLGEKISLVASGADIYKWNPIDQIDSIEDSKATINPDRNTVYSVTGYNQNGCYDSLTAPVFVFCESCSNDNVLFNLFGDINHGCSDRIYNPGSNCSWTIIPSGAKDVFLRIYPENFDIKSGDKLMIYDGLNTAGTLLGSFDNNSPPDGIIKAGNSMFIKFTSDNAGNGTGFQGRFWTDLASSLEDGDDLMDFLIYPNPAQDYVNVRINSERFVGSTVTILDLSGRTLTAKSDLAFGDNRIQVNGIGKGMHLIKIWTVDIVRYKLILIK